MSETKENLSIKKRILPTLLISVVLPFIVTISVPLEIFANNIEEFNFVLSDFIGTSLIFFLGSSAVFFFALLALPKRAYRIVSAILISLALMFFIQGTYLNQGFDSLQGDNMGAAELSLTTKILNTALWVIVVAVAIVLACLKDKKGVVSLTGIIASVIVLATQIMSPLSIALTNPEVFTAQSGELKTNNSKKEHEILSYKNITQVSNNKNIFYFCIDRFDELYAEYAYAQQPEIFSELTGFTWFQDNISIYNHTYPAIAHMLTMKNYDASKSRTEYLENLYTENTTLSVLNENNYSINLYSDSYYSFTDASSLPDYVENAVTPVSYEITSPFGLSFGMTFTSLFRGSPTLLKTVYKDVNSYTCNSFVLEKDADGNESFKTDLDSVYETVLDKNFNGTDKNNFSFIHTSGCHNVNYSRESNNLQQQSSTIINTVKKNFDIVNKYIKYLKEQGLYENSTIIITGDHPHHVDDLPHTINSPRLTALFVKPAGSSTEPLTISQAQVSHDNIWATIMQSENITTSNDYGTSVFDIPEGVNQTRRYVWHTYSDDFAESTYSITGPGADFANWELTSKTIQYGRRLYD